MKEDGMYWRRNFQALILQLVALTIMCVWIRNPWVALVVTYLMCYAVIHATTRDGEIMDWLIDCLCWALLGRPVLAILAGSVWIATHLWRGLTGRRRKTGKSPKPGATAHLGSLQEAVEAIQRSRPHQPLLEFYQEVLSKNLGAEEAVAEVDKVVQAVKEGKLPPWPEQDVCQEGGADGQEGVR